MLCAMDLATADLMDRDDGSLQSCTVQFRSFGRKRRFHGSARTLRTRDDNAQVKALLAQPGNGGILVIDGGGSLRCALLGDQLATLGAANGWSGVIIHGAVRDTAALAGIDLGIKALGSNPRKSAKLGNGAIDGAVTFGDITIRPGDWVYADDDGIVVSPRRLH